MGADERLFRFQKVAFPNLIVPRWIPPGPDESLPAYADRFARHIDPGVPFFIGGVSLGGMIAVEMARRFSCGKNVWQSSSRQPSIKGCFLIASIRGPDELPRRAKMFRPLLPLALGALSTVPFVARLLHAIAGWTLGLHRRDVLRQLADSDPAFLRWSARAILTWELARKQETAAIRAGSSDVPVFQIHGVRDRILPIRRTQPDRRVIRGGHIDLTLTHADEVNDFLRNHLIGDPA